MIPGASYINNSFRPSLLSKSRQKADIEKTSMMAIDHGSTLPKAKGENIKTNMKSIKMVLFILSCLYAELLRRSLTKPHNPILIRASRLSGFPGQAME
jgi:hypothetical protein